MAGENVADAIGKGSEALLVRVTDNLQLCQFVMGIVSMLAITAEERGCDLGGVTVGPLTMSGLRMKAKVRFAKMPVRRASPAIPQVNDFMHFLKAEAQGLYFFIARNPDILVWLASVVEKMERHAAFKQVAFSALTFGDTKKPGDSAAVCLSKDDEIIMELDP